MKFLVGSVTWLEEGFPGREKVLQNHLVTIREKTKHPFDLMIVDNNSYQPVKDFVAKQNTIKTIYNPSNLGWSYARNQIINYFMDNDYDWCILMDCDMGVITDEWLENIEIFLTKNPEVRYLMSRPDWYAPDRPEVDYKGDKLFIWTEHLGAVNMVSRDAINLIGGYNYTDLPNKWGFHDCEYGRRVLKAGLLDWVPRQFGGFYPSLSNVRFDIGHDSKYIDTVSGPRSKEAFAYQPRFWEIVNEIFTGRRPVFYDYKQCR